MLKRLALALAFLCCASFALADDGLHIVSPPVSSGGAGTGIASLTNYTPGRYYRPIGIEAGGTGTAGSTGKITCLPGAIGQKATVSAVASYVTTSATANFQWGIYASSAGTPGALIVAGGQASTSTANTMAQSTLTTATQFGPGSTNGAAVWFCEQVSSASPVLYSAQAGTAGVPGGAAYNGQQLTTSTTQVSGIACTTSCAGGTPTFGTMPATLAGSSWADNSTGTTPAPYLVFSSVP